MKKEEQKSKENKEESIEEKAQRALNQLDVIEEFVYLFKQFRTQYEAPEPGKENNN